MVDKVATDRFGKTPKDIEHTATPLTEYVALVWPRALAVLMSGTENTQQPVTLVLDASFPETDTDPVIDPVRVRVMHGLAQTWLRNKREHPDPTTWVMNNYNLFIELLWYVEQTLEGAVVFERLIPAPVAAANRYIKSDGTPFMLVGARHWSPAMCAQWRTMVNDIPKAQVRAVRESEEQGFIDQQDRFLNRFEAYVMEQVRRDMQSYYRLPKAGNLHEATLWSEDLY